MSGISAGRGDGEAGVLDRCVDDVEQLEELVADRVLAPERLEKVRERLAAGCAGAEAPGEHRQQPLLTLVEVALARRLRRSKQLSR